MPLFRKFILLMKSALPAQKKKHNFAWVLDEEKYLKLDEVRSLRRACREARNKALRHGKPTPVRDWFMTELGLESGLRVEEMTDLKCGDLHIQAEQSSVSVRKGKGDKPRTVRISKRFKSVYKWFLEWKAGHGQEIAPEAYVLTTGKGQQLSTRALQKAFKRCMARAGLPARYSIHSLRHTYGTHLLKAGRYNLRLVQEQLGHSSVRVTEVYAGLIDTDVKQAVERLYR